MHHPKTYKVKSGIFKWFKINIAPIIRDNLNSELLSSLGVDGEKYTQNNSEAANALVMRYVNFQKQDIFQFVTFLEECVQEQQNGGGSGLNSGDSSLGGSGGSGLNNDDFRSGGGPRLNSGDSRSGGGSRLNSGDLCGSGGGSDSHLSGGGAASHGLGSGCAGHSSSGSQSSSICGSSIGSCTVNLTNVTQSPQAQVLSSLTISLTSLLSQLPISSISCRPVKTSYLPKPATVKSDKPFFLATLNNSIKKCSRCGHVTRFGKIHLNAVKLIIRYDHLLSFY